MVADHNHITQCRSGVEGCPACERIRPERMTLRFGYFQWAEVRSQEDQ